MSDDGFKIYLFSQGCDIRLNSLVTIILNDLTNQEDSQLSFLSEVNFDIWMM